MLYVLRPIIKCLLMLHFAFLCVAYNPVISRLVLTVPCGKSRYLRARILHLPGAHSELIYLKPTLLYCLSELALSKPLTRVLTSRTIVIKIGAQRGAPSPLSLLYLAIKFCNKIWQTLTTSIVYLGIIEHFIAVHSLATVE